MPTFEEIYAQHAADYDALVAREDYPGNLALALEKIRPLAGLDVVEFGAGTGRLTTLIASKAGHIRLFDASAHMLETAIAKMQRMNLHNWQASVADNRDIPVATASADLAIEGWSFGHSCGWYPNTWREEIRRAVQEMLRVLRPGGTAIILETLGTGRETPQPPTEALGAYYGWLSHEWGFSSSWVRTDYRFQSPEEAERLTRFFFGDELADQVARERAVVVPECTGIWWLNV